MMIASINSHILEMFKNYEKSNIINTFPILHVLLLFLGFTNMAWHRYISYTGGTRRNLERREKEIRLDSMVTPNSSESGAKGRVTPVCVLSRIHL